MKNVSTGTGLVALSAAILGATALIRFGPAEGTAHAGIPAAPIAAGAIAAAGSGQVTPTIVWYGSTGLVQADMTTWKFVLIRAWSDGRVEARRNYTSLSSCGIGPDCGWYVINDHAQGLTYRSDINFDAKVDGADLGQLLADWGNAPRQDIPPSDCPLAVINP
jgi:hypothetical protein